MSWFDLLAAPLLAGFFIATLAAPLGCLVVWRRMAFVSDTMAHAALLGLALAAPLHIGSEFGIILITAVLVIPAHRRFACWLFCRKPGFGHDPNQRHRAKQRPSRPAFWRYLEYRLA